MEGNQFTNDEEFLDEDIYIMELHRRLNLMKNERRKAEEDNKLLDNRVNLLKTEEEKTWKKIAHTKKKTNEKMIHLQRLANEMRQKEILRENREREVEYKKALNQQKKNELRNNIQMKKDEKLRQINEEARILKLQKQYNNELTKYMRIEEVNNNKNRYETVKGQHLIVEEKKKALQMERKIKLKMELEKKLMEEYRLKEEAEVLYYLILE
jgi:hypothetical protein